MDVDVAHTLIPGAHDILAAKIAKTTIAVNLAVAAGVRTALLTSTSKKAPSSGQIGARTSYPMWNF
ncbi:MAG: hypothetical protein WA970_08595 [Gammaproteobacteria bacterium]